MIEIGAQQVHGPLVGDLGQGGAATRTHRYSDETLNLKGFQGLPHGAFAYPEGLRQLSLGRKAVTGDQVSLGHPALDLFGDNVRSLQETEFTAPRGRWSGDLAHHPDDPVCYYSSDHGSWSRQPSTRFHPGMKPMRSLGGTHCQKPVSW